MQLRGISLDLNAELLRKGLSGRRVGVWGHIKPFVAEGNQIDLAIERRQMRRSDHVFAYTESGAEAAVAAGVDSSSVTCVMNSTDVSALLAAYQGISPGASARFEREKGLVPGKAFGWIGGLDAAKRVSFLVDVLDRLWELDPEIKLVVGGRGDEEHLLTPAVARGQAVLLGFVGDEEKALIFKSCQTLLNPGRVGLIAVECQALQIPILTTDWPFHAPEYEYLIEGQDLFVSPNTVEGYTRLVLDRARGRLTTSSHRVCGYPTLEQMTQNFARGVCAMMG